MSDQLIKDVQELKIQINGNPNNNDDRGLIGISQDHESRLVTSEKYWSAFSAFVLIALIGVCTYFFSMLTNGNDTNNNNNNSNGMGNNSELFRGKQPNHSANSKQYESC